MSLSLVICPVAADPNRMILSGLATVRTRRTTSFSSVSSTFIQFHHTQSRRQMHERISSRDLVKREKRRLRRMPACRSSPVVLLPCNAVQALTPESGTNTFGREGFLIHGDSVQNPGTASHGCIILPQLGR